jgi:hypothetical protein
MYNMIAKAILKSNVGYDLPLIDCKDPLIILALGFFPKFLLLFSLLNELTRTPHPFIHSSHPNLTRWHIVECSRAKSHPFAWLCFIRNIATFSWPRLQSFDRSNAYGQLLHAK